MERRTSQRKPIYLKAKLSWQRRTNWPCTIEDFCAEGLFIKFDAVYADQVKFAYSQQADNALNVSFTIGEKAYDILVKPVRMVEGAVGAMFMQSHPDVFAAMLRECSRSTGSARVLPENNKAAFITRQFTKALTTQLQPLADTFFDVVDVQLKEAANHATTDRIANGILDCASLISRSRRIIAANFMDYLSTPSKTPTPQTQNESSLSLIDKNEFEDWLTVKVMITKAETLYRGQLLQLKMRLDKVGIVNATGYQNPYGPALLCYAFKAASDPLKMLKQAEKVYYKTFETEVLQKLEEVFVELNQILIRQNVLPDLDLSKYVSTQKPSQGEHKETTDKPVVQAQKTEEGGQQAKANRGEPTSAQETGQKGVSPSTVTQTPPTASPKPAHIPVSGAVAETEHSAPGGHAHKERKPPVEPNREEIMRKALIPPFDPENLPSSTLTRFSENRSAAESVFSAVKNLFSVLENTKKGLPPDAHSAIDPNKPKWSPAELQKSLQRLQQLTALGEVSGLAESSLTERISSELKAKHPEADKMLDGDQEQTLDVVDRFFTSMVSSEKITDQVKTQLNKLQVPVVKLLLKDKLFLERPDSPMRSLLNRIAQLGLKGGRPSPAVQQKIDTVIDRINDEFDQDTGVFDDAVKDLDSMIERQNLLYRRNVERVMSAAEGAQKVDLAKHVVSEEIEKRIAGRKIPKAVVTLINGGWRDLLSLTYIRRGEDSSAWQDYLRVIDTLVAFGDNPHMALNLSELLKIIQDGLSTISSNHMPSGHIRDELKRFLVGGKDHAPEMIEMPPSVPNELGRSPQLLAESHNKGLQRWIQRAQKLEVGSWIRHIKKEQEPTFMRLVWVGKGYSKFVFVNHQGMKVIELDLLKLAGMMQRGSLVYDPAYETPIVDESLDNMVKQVYEKLSYVTTHDEITGLTNRKEIERSIERVLAKGIKSAGCSLIYVDLRQFKIINDSAGYDAGDRLLKDVAEILKSYAPKGATVARMAGNEFAVLVERSDIEGLARQYIKSIQDYRLKWDGQEYTVSVSLGLAVSNEYLTNTEKLLGAAESACLTSKKQGANKLYVYNSDRSNFTQQEQIVAKVAGFKDLNKERILLRCQKILPLHSEVKWGTHYEILLSVYDDKGHLIPAAEFVRTAELYNRMQTVDRWVVGHMMDWMVENKAAMERMGGVSINLSGHSLNDETLLEYVYDKLSRKEAPIEKICFEITDASAISNLSDVADFIRELKETGCRFSLGNFGAGSASHNLLRTLPVDVIKVDGSFIQEIAKSSSDQAMVRSMAEMAHLMGKELIACQVEDKSALELLKSLGVDYAQGFGIEKPRLINSL